MINIIIKDIPHVSRSKYYKGTNNGGSSFIYNGSSTTISESTTESNMLSYINVISGDTINVLSANYIYIISGVTTANLTMTNNVSKLVVTSIRNNSNSTVTLRNKFDIELYGNTYITDTLDIKLTSGSTLILNVKPDSNTVLASLINSVINGGTW